MKKHPLLLSFLILIQSFNLSAQPRDPNKVKENASFALNQGRTTRVELPYKKSRAAGNGEINIYAVVVGIGDYTAMPRLQYTDDDARLFYDQLTSAGGGSIPGNHIKLLVDDDATKQNVLQSLRQMARKADGNDVFIFYFSGHGLNGSFVPVDYDGFNNLLRHEEILQILESSGAKQKLCIADACFSGALDYGNTIVAKGIDETPRECYYHAFEQAEAGTALLLSSNPGEVSLEDRRLHHGVFTYFVLKGMRGAADFDRNDIVSIQELFQYVYHNVAEYTEGAQSPVLTGDYDNNMPVAFAHQMN